jgi:hypothetical protein
MLQESPATPPQAGVETQSGQSPQAVAAESVPGSGEGGSATSQATVVADSLPFAEQLAPTTAGAIPWPAVAAA